MTDAPIFRFRGSEPPTAGSRASVLEADPAAPDGVVELYLYDPIDSWGGMWGVSAKEFAQALASIPDDTSEIRLHINSPGGEVWEMFAIINLLRRHSARVVAIVDGLAASAASVIAASADECVMGVGAQMMIHDASTLAWGNEADMLKQAGLLGRDSDVIAGMYATKAGGTADEWRALMRDETWFYGAEAVAAGLADRAEGGDAATTASVATLPDFRYAGRAAAPAPRIPQRATTTASAVATKPPASSEPGETNRKENPVDHTEFVSGLRTRLGVTDANATEETILAALDETLAEQAAPTASIPDGTILVDKVQFDELRTQAAEGAQARTQQISERRDALVDAAVAEGRIAPANREVWRERLDENEVGTVALMGTLPTNKVVPVAPLGYVGGEAEASEDALYAALYPQTKKES